MRVLLVEDEAETRTALEQSLHCPAEGVSVFGSFGTGTEALAVAPSEPAPEVCLIDLGLPDMPGLALIARLLEKYPDTIILVLTVLDDEETILSALRAGATGYLLKHRFDPGAPLRRALAEAHQGGAPMSPRVARIVVDALRRDRQAVQTAPGAAPGEDAREPLTERQREVLTLLARGLTYAEVAEELGIRLGTVQTHVKALYAKLRVSSRIEAWRASESGRGT